MKSYKNLFDVCISEENRKRAISQAKHSKRVKRIIRKRNLTDEELLDKSYDWIMDFRAPAHNPITIYDGISRKQRKIIVPTIEELVVQHCVVNALKPMIYHGMYEHSYASLPKRGGHKAKKQMVKWIQRDRKNTKYVLKMDIRHFFDSIPHDILKRKLAKVIRDDRILDLLCKIIDSTDHGLPLGFYSSQWLSNWYLQGLDHYIKEQLGAKYYVRYMDDMVIFGANKKKLHKTRQAISDYLEKELGLTLKENWQVYRFDKNGKYRDVDFMGFRFYRDRTTLRRSIMLKATRKARRIAKKSKTTIYDCRQMLSYLGWIKATQTYQMYLQRIKPKVNFQRLKRYVSRYDKVIERRTYEKLARMYGGG